MTTAAECTGAERTEEQARAAGYTKHVQADCTSYTLDLLIKPHADLDERFRAYDLDEGEYVDVNGWLWTFEDL